MDETPRRPRCWPLRVNLPLALGIALLAVMALSAVFAPLLRPAGPMVVDLASVRLPPSWEHWFGTDAIGRDVLARTLFGGRVSLLVAGAGMVGSLLVGAVMGMLGAFGGRYVRLIVDRVIDIQLAFPYVLLAIAITSAIRPIGSRADPADGSGPAWAGAARVACAIALQERAQGSA